MTLCLRVALFTVCPWLNRRRVERRSSLAVDFKSCKGGSGCGSLVSTVEADSLGLFIELIMIAFAE